MKKSIHPELYILQILCSCGNKFNLFSTLNKKKLNIDVCNKCHPFYTGKQKIIDSSGRVDNFYRKFKIDIK